MGKSGKTVSSYFGCGALTFKRIIFVLMRAIQHSHTRLRGPVGKETLGFLLIPLRANLLNRFLINGNRALCSREIYWCNCLVD